jgi:prevent-host-death family protein
MPAVMTSREFARHTYRAQQEAEKSPVVITNRGRPAHVLLSYADYQKLAEGRRSALEVLQSLNYPDSAADIELEISLRSKAQRLPVNFV